jgi:hypothetical protein
MALSVEPLHLFGLNCVQVTQESARNGYDPEHETETIPVSTNELHTIYAYRRSLSAILRLAVVIMNNHAHNWPFCKPLASNTLTGFPSILGSVIICRKCP